MKSLKVILPIIVVLLTVAACLIIVNSKPEPERTDPKPLAPVVETITVQPETVQVTVDSQGTVQPRTQTTLVAEVGGRIIEVADNFRPGGYFSKGDILLKIDDADLQATLAQEEATLAQAEYNLEQERALAEQAEIDWKDLGQGDPTDLALRKPQIKQAEAAMSSAKARVLKAQRDLDRSLIKAPYDCLVLEQLVDLGGYVTGNPGTQLARIYSTDTAEIRLPLSSEQLSLIELPFAYVGEAAKPGPVVQLTATYGGQSYQWEGRIIRTEASMDSKSRLTYVVAEVANPFARDSEHPNRPPLKPGIFVQAQIKGRELTDAFVISRYALREGNTVLVVGEGDTLQRKVVTVIQATEEFAIITQGIKGGDPVITSPLEYAIEGMKLSPTQGEDE